jgi:hypothetical protein
LVLKDAIDGKYLEIIEVCYYDKNKIIFLPFTSKIESFLGEIKK